ncbi:MAG: hypothetical protein E7562_06825 [Ruminococcaceae bacterium]|nr:hypothetical protein [Oscillospiraceae bacterium]
MTASQIKEYVKINRRRLSPSAVDSSNVDVTALESDMKKICEYEKVADKTYKELKKDSGNRFKFSCISVWGFIICCLPVFMMMIYTSSIQIPWVNNIVSAFGDEAENLALVAFMFSVIMFLARDAFVFMSRVTGEYFSTTALYLSAILRTALAVYCFYSYAFGETVIFGNKANWFAVYILGGILSVILCRLIEIKKVSESNSQIAENCKMIEEGNALIDELSQKYVSLGDKAQQELETFISNNGLELAVSPRKAWMDYKRSYDEKRPFSCGTLRKAGTDFEKKFEDCQYRETESDIDYTVETYVTVNSQQFGYEEISKEKAEKLLRKNKISPFFHMGIPEFLPEFKYKLMIHKWDITIDIETTGSYSVNKRFDSQQQREFDSTVSGVEDILFGAGKYDKLKYSGNNDAATQGLINRYESIKEKKREELGYNTVHTTQSFDRKRREYDYGKEIGALLIYSQDDELLGAYCSDSYESIEFTNREVKAHGIEGVSLFSQPFSKAQEIYLRLMIK